MKERQHEANGVLLFGYILGFHDMLKKQFDKKKTLAFYAFLYSAIDSYLKGGAVSVIMHTYKHISRQTANKHTDRHFDHFPIYYLIKLLFYRNGKAMYEKNVAPLLHLAGLEVTLVKVTKIVGFFKFTELQL